MTAAFHQHVRHGLLALIGVVMIVAHSRAAVVHPMDPLTEDEILGAAFVLLGAGAARPGAIFQSIDLREPSKESVLSFVPGSAVTPRAATVFFRQDKKSYRTVVNLTAGTFTPPQLIPRSDGQLGLTITEVSDFSFAFSDPKFLAALARRGITTPAQLANVLVTPLTAGSFGLPEEARRIVKAQMYYRENAAINLYARPIEGMQAIMDLDDRVVLQVIDTGALPLPATAEFDEGTVAAKYGLRPALKPIRITQPEGRNVSFDGNFVQWQKWKFHVRFERRPGTVISLASYDGRSILYQGSLAEIFVPYQDPDINWFYRTFMDAGEFGAGLLASPLRPGLDVPPNAVLLDALVSAAIPVPDIPVVPLPLPQVVGIFERLTGNPAWRHFELFAGPAPAYEGRAEVELVVRTISQLGNYDYLFDWVFSQNGVIRVEVALTGIDAPKAVRSLTLASPGAAQDVRYGALVAPNLVAPNHSHFFNFRLDLDVDGRNNSFMLGRLERKNGVPGPRKSVWAVEEQRLEREQDGRLDSDHSLWKVVNQGRTNARGYHTGYALETHSDAEPLLKKADYLRAGFIEHALWVTRYDPDQRFASGDTPNENPGEPGLPLYQKDNASIANTDLVLWLTIGHHHVTATEDFPVLSLEPMSFKLKPMNFFDRNPALDLRRAPFEVVP